MEVGNSINDGSVNKTDDFKAGVQQKRKRLLIVSIFTVIVVLLSNLYLINQWNGYQDQAGLEAIGLAKSVEAMLPQENISKLTGSADDLNKLEYDLLKRHFSQLVATINPIRFAYLFTKRDDKIVVLVDSESPDSDDYSPPGQGYREADQSIYTVFQSGETILTKPTTNRRGTWISALVPVKDPTNDNIVAVFRIDFSAAEWYAQLRNHMIPDISVIVCVLLLYFALIYGWTQYNKNSMLTKQLAYDEALYHSAFDQAPIGVAIFNDKNFVDQSTFGNLSINPMFEKILGRTRHELSTIKWPEITHPDDLPADLEKFEQFKNGEISGYSMEKRFLKSDGSAVWVDMIISPFSGVLENNSLHLCLIEDITVRREAQELLRESDRRQAVILSKLPGLAYRCNYDPEWTMQFVSDGCYDLTGYTPDSLINNKDLSFNDLITPEYRDDLWNEWKVILAQKQPFKHEYEITTAEGKRKWVIEMGQGIYGDNGEIEALEGIVLDISDRKEMEDDLRYINEHDRWTGLYNRDFLELLLEKDAKEKKSQNRALIGINLSTVQLLTANYGFRYTQRLMKKAAVSLGQYITDECMLFNTYENRFVFYWKNYKGTKELTDFCNAIAKTLDLQFVTERVGGGIGIYEIGQVNEVQVDLLLKRLLIASEKSIDIFDKEYRACFYNEDLEALVIREGDLRHELTRIAKDIHCEELFLQYQPILNLKTDLICGFEALARVKTEKLGLVSPMEFIPIAEKTKLIIPLGEKIIIDALEFLKKLEEQGFGEVYIAINISAIQLLIPDFTERLSELISGLKVNPKNIGIEITESVFASNYQEINNILTKLKDIGIHIAIDDFGTGYSSLARQKELNVDGLKIDKYFMDKLLEDHDKAITGDIISMAHRLGHWTIAEGVEFEEQKQYLIAHGCDKIQGYLISRPLDEDKAIAFLEQ